MKAKLFSLETKSEERMQEEMRMTPQERMNLVFQLIEVARAFSPAKDKFYHDDGSIPWINLTLKHGGD